MTTQTKVESVFVILAEGLDACVDEKRGWTEKHERARMLADAAPDLLAACKQAFAVVRKSRVDLLLADVLAAAIAKAEERDQS